MLTGGFGGAEGLARVLGEERFDLVIDATHPFAVQMKANAIKAARAAGVPLLAIRRPAWVPRDGDRWIMVENLEAAADAIGEKPRRVFLTTGRMELAPFRSAPQHFYIVRSVEAPSPRELPPRVELIAARGPFKLEDEKALLAERKIEVIVTKNSGGAGAEAKLEAARVAVAARHHGHAPAICRRRLPSRPSPMRLPGSNGIMTRPAPRDVACRRNACLCCR